MQGVKQEEKDKKETRKRQPGETRRRGGLFDLEKMNQQSKQRNVGYASPYMMCCLSLSEDISFRYLRITLFEVY